MKYRVLFLTPDQPEVFLEETKGQPREWNDPKDASACAKRWNAWYKEKGFTQRFRIVEHLTPEDTEKGKAWRERESTRLTDGTYFPVPWLNEKWYLTSRYATLHFPHLSQKKTERGMLAYTPDETHGLEDRQVPVKIGRYLHKYFDLVLSGTDVADWCAKVGVEDEDIKLSFARDAAEMERVYRDGPSSCMSHDKSHYKARVHPVAGYTTGDVEIAYLTRWDAGTEAFRITARCVTRPEKKTFGRVYGDVQRIVPLLQRAGYKEDLKGCLLGARLKRIVDQGTYLLPFIDNITRGSSDGHHIIVDGTGPISLQQSSCRAAMPKCGYCGRNEDVLKVIRGGSAACPTCYAQHSTKCDFCDNVGDSKNSGFNYKNKHWWCGCEAGKAALDRCRHCGHWRENDAFPGVMHFSRGKVCNICAGSVFAYKTAGCQRLRAASEACICRLCQEVAAKISPDQGPKVDAAAPQPAMQQQFDLAWTTTSATVVQGPDGLIWIPVNPYNPGSR